MAVRLIVTVLQYYSVVVRPIVTVLQYYNVVVRPRATVLQCGCWAKSYFTTVTVL